MLDSINRSIKTCWYLDHASRLSRTLLHICSRYYRIACLIIHQRKLDSINCSIKNLLLPWPCFLPSLYSPSYLAPSTWACLPIKAKNMLDSINRSIKTCCYLDHANCLSRTLLPKYTCHYRIACLIIHQRKLDSINRPIKTCWYLDHEASLPWTLLHIWTHQLWRACLLKQKIC